MTQRRNMGDRFHILSKKFTVSSHSTLHSLPPVWSFDVNIAAIQHGHHGHLGCVVVAAGGSPDGEPPVLVPGHRHHHVGTTMTTVTTTWPGTSPSCGWSGPACCGCAAPPPPPPRSAGHRAPRRGACRSRQPGTRTIRAREISTIG